MEETSNESVTTEVQSDIEKPEVNDVKVEHSPELLTEKLVSVSAEAKRRRLEAKEAKEEAEKLRAKLAEVEEAGLKEQGKYKELYEKEVQARNELKNQFEEKIGTYALKTLKSSVESELVKAGCTRTDAILKLFHDDIVKLDYDNDWNADANQAQELVKAAQEKYSEFFKKETPKIHDPVPGAPVKEKGPSQMSKAEILAQLGVRKL